MANGKFFFFVLNFKAAQPIQQIYSLIHTTLKAYIAIANNIASEKEIDRYCVSGKYLIVC